MEIPIVYDLVEEGEYSPECEYPAASSPNLAGGAKTDSSDEDRKVRRKPNFLEFLLNFAVFPG